jgi:hypothetical protein
VKNGVHNNLNPRRSVIVILFKGHLKNATARFWKQLKGGTYTLLLNFINKDAWEEKLHFAPVSDFDHRSIFCQIKDIPPA